MIAAVKFASAKNIRLNAKSTGHSFSGRSTAFGSLSYVCSRRWRNEFADSSSIWTYNMRGFEYHEDFTAESCSPSKAGAQMAFTIAAGERVRVVYVAAHEKNAVVVAGVAASVGIVGWFSGGGKLTSLEDSFPYIF
jgi:hypothetical protein